MTEKNIRFTGTIPEFYDRHLGPVLFEPYALDMATRVAAVAPSGPVLETACGSGILTRHLRAKLLTTAQIVATDLHQSMLDLAQKKEGITQDVEWKVADACSLPFSDRMFAAVVNQFGMMFMPDKNLAIREAERVLKDGGFFGFNVWGGLEENVFARIAHERVTSFFRTNPPTFYMVPFGFADMGMWTTLLAENAFGQVEVHRLPGECRSESAKSLAIGMIRGNTTADAIVEQGLSMDEIIEAVTADLVKLGGDAPFTCEMIAYVITARANS